MREFKAILGIYGKHNNLIGCYEDHIRVNTTKQAHKIALDTRKCLEQEHQRVVKLLSLTFMLEQEQGNKYPF